MAKIPATVEILTFNNKSTIAKTLESVRDFDDILALDGGSTDGTLEILHSFGARILPQEPDSTGPRPISDFSKVRNRGLLEAKHPWFLFIDSDEALTPEISNEIWEIAESPKPNFYIWNVPRKYTINGELINCATTYPNTQPRFFHRDYVEGFIKPIHEKIVPRAGVRAGTLKNHMLVPLSPAKELWAKWQRYLMLEDKRWGEMSRTEALQKSANALKPIVLYFLRLPKRFFCRGRSMPLSYEFLYQRYNFALLFKLLKRLI